jgi:hypothetical protein
MSVGDLFFPIQSVTLDADPVEYYLVSTHENPVDT